MQHEMSPRQREALARAFVSGDIDRKSAALDRVAPWGEARYQTLWGLIRGRVVSARDPDAWDLLAEGPKWATAQDVWALLRELESAPPREGILCRAWPRSLDTLVCHAFARDATYFESRKDDLPVVFRDGLATVLRRFDRIPRTALPRGIIEHIARSYLAGHLDGPVMMLRGDQLAALCLPRDEADLRVRRFVRVFAPKATWAQALLHAALMTNGPLDHLRLGAALDVATDAQKEVLNARCETTGHSTRQPWDARTLARAGTVPVP